MTFETILEEINGFGPFQITVLILVSVPRLVLPSHFLLNNFIAGVPPHHCDISTLDDGQLFRNLTQQQRLAVSIPVQGDGIPKSCEVFARPQLQLLSVSSNSTELPTVRCQSGWVYDNSTFTSTIATEVRMWTYLVEKKSNLSWFQTCSYINGGFIKGYEMWGRKMLHLSYIIRRGYCRGLCYVMNSTFQGYLSPRIVTLTLSVLQSGHMELVINLISQTRMSPLRVFSTKLN